MQKTPLVQSEGEHFSKEDRIFSGAFSLGNLFLGCLTALCLLLILCHSEVAIRCMERGLWLCASTVIPSLFPFMVLSELLVACGGAEVLGGICEKPFRKLFGISGAGAGAVMMGWICGFPVGTKTAVALCRRGDISSAELSRLICFCNIPSSAFLINAVGLSLFGSRRFGITLYIICLASALLTAILLYRLTPLSPAPSQGKTADAFAPHGVAIFTSSVSSAALAMLYVCAYVVFFSALVGTLGHVLSTLGVSQTITALLFGLFELSGGVLEASSLPCREAGQWIVAILCGWSGLSVHMQILSLCHTLPAGAHVSFRPFFLSKLFQAVLCSLLFGIAALLAPSRLFAQAVSIPTFSVPPLLGDHFQVIINVSFVFSIIFLASRRFGSKK